MNNITGIKVELALQSQWWAPSKDALFLGVYGTNGGREFRLKIEDNSQTENSDKPMVLTLGKPCCKSDADIPVLYSIDQGINDPLLNPIALRAIEFPTFKDDTQLQVYLRKETADSTTVNDDALVLAYVNVLLCSENGDMRRFKKLKNINFSDEAGLQHWLTEVSPPTCHVRVELTGIHQEHADQPGKSAGRHWDLDFGSALGTSISSYNSKNMLDNHRHVVDRKHSPHWKLGVYKARNFSMTACCGSTLAITLGAAAHELDSIGKREKPFDGVHDFGAGQATHQVTCNTTPVTEQHSLSFIVDEQASSQRKSKLTYFYNITAYCDN